MASKKDLDTLENLGERAIKSAIFQRLTPPELLLGGYGHDAGFLECELENDEVLVINTDRSGMNIAYKYGLAGGECVGSLAVSHAVSDVIAAGGIPVAISIALLLPGDCTLGFLEEIIDGITQSCARYNVVLTGGDTKKSDKLAIVVTAIGKARREARLERTSVKLGDALVVTGYLGSMLLGCAVHNEKLSVTTEEKKVLDHALIHQQPPHDLGLRISEAGLANACTDISDGLPSALRNMLSISGFGASIKESSIPVHPSLLPLSESMSLSRMQLSMAGGDWEYLYSLPYDNVDAVQKLSVESDIPIAVIGSVCQKSGVTVEKCGGGNAKLKFIEHDSFRDRVDGVSYFEMLSKPLSCYEE